MTGDEDKPRYSYSEDGKTVTWLNPQIVSSRRLDVMAEGQQVRKLKGYPFDGEVRAAFLTTRGSLRYVVESTTLPGLLHIFAPEQIEVAP